MKRPSPLGRVSPASALPVALVGMLLAGTSLHAEPPVPAAPKQGSSAPQPAATNRLDELAWLEGHWRDDSGGSLSEEIWTAPSGDSVMGMWRWAQDGKVRIFELLAIKAEEGKLVLRFRHFDPKLVAREEKDRPLAWPIIRSGPREAVFEGPEASGQGTSRLTYRRSDEETLVVILEKGGKPQEFRYRRVQPAVPTGRVSGDTSPEKTQPR
ncbi:DUF6265 family protein [Hyalangium sp.]|uniref:DUF6265 family protein n=1 Tax=Hyalangium sp. TaxID=2028555 RepID=UPI002D415E15|nr:DUF6265 family protein [Hyalangium sp.]HYI01970.1 DUF6265 family protein [Hyalangium sp.]